MSLKFYTVPDYEFAEVTRCGVVRNARTKNILKPHHDKDGYLKYKVWVDGTSKSLLAHRAIAKAFVGNPYNKPQVNHKNSVRDDNRVENLEWVTPKENSQHGTKKGFIIKGEDNHLSKIDEETADEICKLLVKGFSGVSISESLGVSVGIVSGVATGKTWKEVSSKYGISRKRVKANDEEALEILELLSRGLSYKEIVNTINKPHINSNTVSNIKLGKTFKHLRRLS